MKKLITVLVCLLFFVQLSAQQFLVPFVFNGKMGLQNEKGKTILPARFDHIDWVTDHYFETSTAIRLDDTLLVEPRQLYVRHEDSKLMGLVYQGKEILKAEPFDDYYILPKKFILAKTEKRIWKQTAAQVKRYGGKEKFSALFSLAGKNMYPENFRRLQVLDTTGKSNRYPGYSRYVLLVTEDFDKKNALIVFDADRQEIVDWLLKDASKLEIERDDFRERNAIRKFSYVDREYEKRVGIVDARSGKFVFTNYAAPAPKKMRDDDELVKVTDGDFGGNVAVPVDMDGERPARALRKTEPYYQKKNDTLFYINADNSTTRVDTSGLQMIYTSPGKYLTQGVILYKQGTRFGLHYNNQPQLLPYDSVVYFGPHFFVGKRIGSQWKYGAISKTDSVIIPLEYDSIKGTQVLQYGDAGQHFKTIEEKERYQYAAKTTKPYQKDFGGNLSVYKNGKMGLLSSNSEILLPVMFEGIWNNGFNFIRPKHSEFYILKQKGKYGAAQLQYDPTTKKRLFKTLLAIKHSGIPLFFYPDYYGIKGINVFGLFNETGKVSGYGVGADAGGL